MTHDQLTQAAEAAKKVREWTFAIAHIEAMSEQSSVELPYSMPNPPTAFFEAYKAAVLDWARGRLKEAEAAFAAF